MVRIDADEPVAAAARARASVVWLTLFAIAMAHVEASLVVHLRSLHYPHNPLALFPLVVLPTRDLAIELSREVATLVMLLCVALLSRRGAIGVFAAFVYAFGVWDLFYYAWLKVMLGWPVAWLEWDVLFLLPWPWFGPWIAAAAIALLFTVWGGWALLGACNRPWHRGMLIPLALFALGSTLVLAAFLLPAAPLLPHGESAFRGFSPDRFHWLLYGAGYALMVAGLGASVPAIRARR